MPLASEVDTSVLFVPVSTRVTVAPATAAPWGSVTVPRRAARYCACAEPRRNMEEKTKVSSTRASKFRLVMEYPSPANFSASTVFPGKRQLQLKDRKSTRLNSSHLGISY